MYRKDVLLWTLFLSHNSQFSYCSLVWMCHSRANHSIINRLRERCLRIIYYDKTRSFEVQLEKDASASIYNRKLHPLATEMYKVSKVLSTPIITELFETKNEHQYNLRRNSQFIIPAVNWVYHGTDRSSLPEVFIGKVVLKICSKFTGDHPCRSVISIKLFATLLKSHFGMGVLL